MKLAINLSRTFNDYNLLCQEMAKVRGEFTIVACATQKEEKSFVDRYAADYDVPIQKETPIIYPDGEGTKRDLGAHLKCLSKVIDSADAVLSFWDGKSAGTLRGIDLGVMKRKYSKVVCFKIPEAEVDNTAVYGFQKQYRWMSNMFPVEIRMGDIVFQSVENAYQASKFIGDKAMIAKLATMPAIEAKKASRLSAIITPNFHERKIAFMETFLRKKFQNPCLRQKLLNTGDAYLEETNTWGDTFWGVAYKIGENHMGKLLMKIRGEISGS